MALVLRRMGPDPWSAVGSASVNSFLPDRQQNHPPTLQYDYEGFGDWVVVVVWGVR